MKNSFFRITSYFLILSFLATTSCSTIMIESKPSGGKILLNGVDSGYRTPIKLRTRNLPLGLHSVSVEKDGYKAVTPPQQLWIKISGAAIFWSILPPVFLIHLMFNRWQSFVQYPRTPFVLEKIPEENVQKSEPPVKQ